MVELVTAEQVRAAARTLDGVLQATPVERSRALSELIGAQVLLKCELLQRTGSFKLRGAYHRIDRLDDVDRARGVVCASAGNHAQGVALAAQLQGVSATVFMPEQAPLPKVEATAAYGAKVRLEGVTLEEAMHAAETFAADSDAVFVHPFDHADIIAGQGTLGLELIDQVPDLATGTVLIPVGGGGLCAGIAVALRDVWPDVTIVGVEAAGAAGAQASLRAGHVVAVEHVDTIADGIAVKQPGELTLAHLRALVDDVVTVDDDTIARALVLLLERAKLVVEPAGAVGVAAILAGEVDARPPVVAVLSGGNIDPLLLQHVVTSGLTAEGRFVTIRTRIPDKPGELHHLLGVLAAERANVVAVEHHRFGRRLRMDEVEVVVELETRGPDHVEQLRERMRGAGYPFERI